MSEKGGKISKRILKIGKKWTKGLIRGNLRGEKVSESCGGIRRQVKSWKFIGSGQIREVITHIRKSLGGNGND